MAKHDCNHINITNAHFSVTWYLEEESVAAGLIVLWNVVCVVYRS
jgi:hypothetical protein